jgi:hypothetical protein
MKPQFSGSVATYKLKDYILLSGGHVQILWYFSHTKLKEALGKI